jgi:hypothetical protein
MPHGTGNPRQWPSNTGAHSSIGTKFAAMEARGDEQLVNWYLTDTLNAFTLAGVVTIGARTFNAVAGHLLVIGDVVEFDLADHFFQAIVTNVVVNAITIDSPFPFAFTVLTNCWRGTKNAAVNGSVTAVPYALYPPPGFIWDISELTIYLQDNAAMTHDVFAGLIAALTNGLYLRVQKTSLLHYEQIANIKSNQDFFVNSWKTKYMSNMGAGQFGLLSVKLFGNEQNMGSDVRLIGNNFDNLEVVVADNLSTLVSVFIKAHGYSLLDGS